MQPKANLGELSDEELEKIAGGTDVATLAAVVFTALAAGMSVASFGQVTGWGT
jgi:hypothetical protein